MCMVSRDFKRVDKEYRVGMKIRIVGVPEDCMGELIGKHATIKEMRFNSFFDSWTFKLGVYGDTLFMEKHIEKIKG